MGQEAGELMLRVTWEWIGISEPALELAHTIAVEKGVEHDLFARDGEYERWARTAAASPALEPDEAAALIDARPRLLELREHRVCGAPSCGMYHRPSRGQQRWRSTQRGTRVRVARHYRPRRRRPSRAP